MNAQIRESKNPRNTIKLSISKPAKNIREISRRMGDLSGKFFIKSGGQVK
jgi:hypothetical protein